uniref:Uncharacterized protein n=1 Tax=Anopheles dirus TaxID=7168 RepID=A0A182NZ63_9DIPT
MKFLEIDDPRDVLPIGCRLLRLFGLPNDSSLKYLFWFQCSFFFIFGIITRFLTEIDEPITLVCVGSEMVYSIYLLFQMGALYLRRNDLYHLVDLLKECVDRSYSDDIEASFIRLNTKINKSAVMYSKYFMMVAITYIAMPFIATTVVCARNMRNSTGEQEEYVIPTELNFFYLDIRHNLLHYTIYFVVVSVLAVIGSIVLCTKDVLDFSLIRTTTMLFQITAMQIRELQAPASQDQIITVIRSHRDTLECFNKLQKVLNIALMIQLTFCTAIWCLMLFYILIIGFDSKVLNVSLLLVILTYETQSYCQYGTQLTEKADEVRIALHQLTWYDQTVSIQKEIFFMIQRSQKPIVLMAGKLFPVNNAQFSEIVKKSYSCYIVLKDVF